MIVVADSSPLLYLSRAGVLAILQLTFGEVLVPAIVWRELVDSNPNAPGVDSLREASWIRIVEVDSSGFDFGLDPGETAAILLAESLRADLPLIDERAGRAVAEARGLAVRGTLGVLVRAREAGHLRVLRPVLDSLATAGFRIAPALVSEALRRVGEDQT